MTLLLLQVAVRFPSEREDSHHPTYRAILGVPQQSPPRNVLPIKPVWLHLVSGYCPSVS